MGRVSVPQIGACALSCGAAVMRAMAHGAVSGWRSRRPTGLTQAARGYDTAHRKARDAAAAKHHPSDACCRCGLPLGPMGPWLHYDHSDDRSRYLGFSHGSCNIRQGARVGNARGRERQRLRYTPTGNDCPVCGKPLTREQISTGRTYCSRRCGWAAHKPDADSPREQFAMDQPGSKTLRR